MTNKLASVIALSLLVTTASIQGQAQSPQRPQSQPVSPDAVIVYVVPDTDTNIGFSAKKALLGKTVYNENKQRIGTITDLIIAPDTSVAYVVIGAGGFVGLGRHNVAVEPTALQARDGRLVLPGATKESLKAAPKLEYPKKRPS